MSPELRWSAFGSKPESSIISSGADAAISLSHYAESKHGTNPRDTTAKSKLLGSNALTDCLLASLHLFVEGGEKKKKKYLTILFKSCERRGFASVHVFVVAHVRVVGLHLALNHRLLPPAAGHRQADQESLGRPQRREGEGGGEEGWEKRGVRKTFH